MTNSKRKRRGPLPLNLGPMEPAGADDWVIFTRPGCDHPLHREEVAGAMMALHLSGPWEGSTDMDCGCTLELMTLKAASHFQRS